jgi:hypothetical protein
MKRINSQLVHVSANAAFRDSHYRGFAVFRAGSSKVLKTGSPPYWPCTSDFFVLASVWVNKVCRHFFNITVKLCAALNSQINDQISGLKFLSIS